jgi:hypothetical protein
METVKRVLIRNPGGIHLIQVFSRIAILIFCASLGAGVSRADSIPAAPNSPGSPQDLVNLLDVNLLDLGFNPAAFLFTGNTMYDYKGEDLLNIIAAEVDPATTNSLEGVPVQNVTINLDSGGALAGGSSQEGIPEPGTLGLFAAGSALILVGRRSLFRRN